MFVNLDPFMASAPDKAELRCMIPADLMQRLDAVAQSKGCESRADWLVPVLEAEVRRELHAAIGLLRMVRINPLAADDTGKVGG